MGREPRILAVSFAFPPLAYPRSIQVGRLLPRLGGTVQLVCGDEVRAAHDPTLEPEAEGRLEACVRIPFRIPRWRRLVGSVAYRVNLPVWDRAPDRYRPWAAEAMRAAERLAAGGGVPDVIVTFGQPMSTHEVGLALRRRWRRPWVAHFSDPWSDNPFRLDRWTRAVNARLERKVVESADRLVFVCEETAEQMTAKYAPAVRARARVVPHAFDRVQFPERVARSGPLLLRHVGNFYEERTPRPLALALRRLFADEPRALDDVQVELVGAMAPGARRASGLEGLPPGLVTVRPPVPYRESLEQMTAADGLLLIDAPAERNVFLPSKLIEYVGARRPILGLTPPGPSAKVIAALGGWVADPLSEREGAAALGRFLAHLRGPERNRAWGAPEVRDRYEAGVVAGSFDGILREVAASGAASAASSS